MLFVDIRKNGSESELQSDGGVRLAIPNYFLRCTIPLYSFDPVIAEENNLVRIKFPAESTSDLCIVVAHSAENSKIVNAAVGRILVDMMDLNRSPSLATDTTGAVGLKQHLRRKRWRNWNALSSSHGLLHCPLSGLFGKRILQMMPPWRRSRQWKIRP
jgi:hypothetical protein